MKRILIVLAIVAATIVATTALAAPAPTPDPTVPTTTTTLVAVDDPPIPTTSTIGDINGPGDGTVPAVPIGCGHLNLPCPPREPCPGQPGAYQPCPRPSIPDTTVAPPNTLPPTL